VFITALFLEKILRRRRNASTTIHPETG
jgi:hypothetical protein